jgi:hypothetical protein
MALSSAELWNDVLQRLSELQESQVVLAHAIAELGTMLKQSTTAGATPALEASTPSGALAVGPVHAEPDVPARPVEVTPVPGGFDAGPIGYATDPVGTLPDDLVAAFYPPDAAVTPWYKRRLSFGSRRRRTATPVEATFSENFAPLPPPPQVLPPPPPPHLLDRYVLDESSLGAAPAVQVPPAAVPVATVPPAAEPVATVPPAAVPVATVPVLEEPPVVASPSDPHEKAMPVASEPRAPQPLVYTPSNAETALANTETALANTEPVLPDVEPLLRTAETPLAGVGGGLSFELDEPAVPLSIPFELDPPQDLAAPDVAVTPPAVPPPPPVPDAMAPSTPAAAPAPVVPEPAVVGAIAGRPVAEAQMSVSMATEILGSAAAAAPSVPSVTGEQAPLVISEDLTLVSKNHRKRRQFRFPLR